MSFLPEGFEKQKVQDFDNDGNFEIMKGKAVVSLDKAARDQGTWNDGSVRDVVKLQWRVKTKIDGNCHVNRVVFKQYNMIDGQYGTGAENRAKLANDLCTAGYDMDCSSEEAFYDSLPDAVGIEANAVLGEYNNKQTIRIVEKFSEKKKVVKEKLEDAPF